MTDSNGDQEKDVGQKKDPECNILRDSLWRYLGYVGHLGWMCRNSLPNPIFSTIGSVAYVFADAMQMSSAAAARGASNEEITKSTGSVFLWHFLATFAIPGIFLFGVHRMVLQVLPVPKCRPRSQTSLLPCILTSSTIPFISGPIDEMVDRIMKKANLMKDTGDHTKCKTTAKKELKIKEEPRKSCSESELETKPEVKSKSSWFFKESRDQADLDLERYKEKAGSVSIGIQVGRSKIDILRSHSTSKSVQVDKDSRPPKDKKDKKPEVKSEVKTEPEVKSEVKTEPEVKSEAKPEPEDKPEVKLEPEEP